MYERFTDRARKVMQLANQEAQRLNHEYIGTEHILLGLAKEGSGVGANALKALNVSLDVIRSRTLRYLKPGPDMITMGKLPQTPRAKSVIEFAVKDSEMLGHRHIGTEHLLLGLLRESEGVASQVLTEQGVSRTSVLEHLEHVRLTLSDNPKTEDEQEVRCEFTFKVPKTSSNRETVRRTLVDFSPGPAAFVFHGVNLAELSGDEARGLAAMLMQREIERRKQLIKDLSPSNKIFGDDESTGFAS